tara:strand:+ start:1254 stop:2720 length:1467 start_codon:yes stop_codon:yes gene_type:complete
MANKLSTILGSESGGGATSAFVDTTAMPMLDYHEFRHGGFGSSEGGTSGWSQYANNIQNTGDLNKASDFQFGFNFQSNNSTDTNKIYHTIVPFQVDANGAITPGSANTIENSSSTSISTTFCRRGFNNTTPNTIGSGNIPGNCAGFVSYGRQHWSGGYQMMSWGGRIGNANTVTTHDRGNYSDYNGSYPHPNEGTFGMTGGGSNTPYYNIVGYDGNSYNYWSGWYYNSGSYPSHWTNNQLATYSSTSGFHNLPQADDSQWDWAGYYKYYYTNDQYGFGTVNYNSSQNNQQNNMRSMWTGLRQGTNWEFLGWRMSQDLAIIYNYTTQEFYTWNPTNSAMVEGYGSPKKVDMADRANFLTYMGSEHWSSNQGNWSMRVRKPWQQPTQIGASYTNDELIGDGNKGFAIRRVTYDSSTQKLKSRIIYHKPMTDGNRLEYKDNGFSPEYAQWSRAGSNGNILVTWEYRDTPARFIVRTFDITNMLTKLEAVVD